MENYNIAFCDNAGITERKDLCPDWQHGISKKYSDSDWELLRSIWFTYLGEIENGAQFSFNPSRNDVLCPYENNDTILTKSQGPKGQWD